MYKTDVIDEVYHLAEIHVPIYVSVLEASRSYTEYLALQTGKGIYRPMSLPSMLVVERISNFIWTHFEADQQFLSVGPKYCGSDWNPLI